MEPTPLPDPQPTDAPSSPPQQPSSQSPPQEVSSAPLPATSLPPTSAPAITPSLIASPNPNPNPHPGPNPSSTAAASLLQQLPQSAPVSHPQPQPTFQPPQARAPLNRPWPQQSTTTQFQHFQSPLPQHVPSPPPATSPSQRGGVAMGYLAAAHPPISAPMQAASLPASFSTPHSNHYGGVPRNLVNVPDSVPGSSPSPARHAIHGLQNAGIMGSHIRPSVVPTHLPQRPVQSSTRPQVPSNNQPPAQQNFQGQGLQRPSSSGSLSTPSPSASQSNQSQHQPWLSSAQHGRPPLPSPSFRTQMNPQSLQQRSHSVQQSHNANLTTSQQQLVPSSQQQQQLVSSSQQQQKPLTPSNPSQEQYEPNTSSSRVPQPLPNQHQTSAPGLGNQKSPSPSMVQAGAVQASSSDRMAIVEADESSNRILSKRSIQELVNQIDPSEHLDPEVEDILLDLTEEFVDSITTFGCSLAKHRKSSTLEAKDILLYLERNWNMTLPGFSGDEIKTYRKPLASDPHRERLAVVRKSMSGPEVVNTKSSAGQGAGNVKGHSSKVPPSAIGS